MKQWGQAAASGTIFYSERYIRGLCTHCQHRRESPADENSPCFEYGLLYGQNGGYFPDCEHWKFAEMEDAKTCANCAWSFKRESGEDGVWYARQCRHREGKGACVKDDDTCERWDAE